MSEIQMVKSHGRARANEQVRRDSILDAADQLLARYGYTKMTIDDLAREADIGKGTVYLHFKSKEDVVLSHVDRIVDRLIDRLEIIARSKNPPELKIRQILSLRVMFRFDSVQHYTESITEVLRSLRLRLVQRRREHFVREAAVLAQVLRDGQRCGAFRRHNSTAISRALISATNGLLPFSLSTAELGKRKDIETLATEVADLLLNGLVSSRVKRTRSAKYN